MRLSHHCDENTDGAARMNWASLLPTCVQQSPNVWLRMKKSALLMPHTSKFKWYSLKWNHVCIPVITAAAHDLTFGASDNRVGFLQGLGDGAPAKQHTSVIRMTQQTSATARKLGRLQGWQPTRGGAAGRHKAHWQNRWSQGEERVGLRKWCADQRNQWVQHEKSAAHLSLLGGTMPGKVITHAAWEGWVGQAVRRRSRQQVPEPHTRAARPVSR
jgi:hypothetical protein